MAPHFDRYTQVLRGFSLCDEGSTGGGDTEEHDESDSGDATSVEGREVSAQFRDRFLAKMTDTVDLLFKDLIDNLSDQSLGDGKGEGERSGAPAAAEEGSGDGKPRSEAQEGRREANYLRKGVRAGAKAVASPLDWMSTFDIDEDEAANPKHGLMGPPSPIQQGFAVDSPPPPPKKRQLFKCPSQKPAAGAKKMKIKERTPLFVPDTFDGGNGPPATEAEEGHMQTASHADMEAKSQDKHRSKGLDCAVEEENKGNGDTKTDEGNQTGETQNAIASATAMSKDHRSASVPESGEVRAQRSIRKERMPEEILQSPRNKQIISTNCKAIQAGSSLLTAPSSRGQLIPITGASEKTCEIAKFLADCSRHMNEIESGSAHIDAQTEHLQKFKEHAEKVHESAKATTWTSSKLHTDLILATSKMVSPLQHLRAMYANHYCFLKAHTCTNDLNV
mmetsp:Transcript_2864/g.7518  ORF Transcript_2864/g.7518 Transcript_2864/m.7518 type:complete len:448 (+) Transcript_2864:118-1461(+)